MVSLMGTGEFLATQLLPSQSLPAPCSLNFPLPGLQSLLLPAPPKHQASFHKAMDRRWGRHGEGAEGEILSHIHYNSRHGPHFLIAFLPLLPMLERRHLVSAPANGPPFSWTSHLPTPSNLLLSDYSDPTSLGCFHPY